jgi:hypothetical protein
MFEQSKRDQGTLEAGVIRPPDWSDSGHAADRVVPTDLAWHAAASGHAEGGRSPAGTLTDQVLLHGNWLQATGDANFFLHVEKNLGSVSDIDVGLIAGGVTEANAASQSASSSSGATAGGGAAAGGQEIEQTAVQENWLEVIGQVDFFLHVEGNLGSIRDIDVGLVAGDVTQANAARQSASSAAWDDAAAAPRTIDQLALQENRLQASGDIDFSLVVKGDVGAIYGIDVGLVAGDVTQVNAAAQAASNAPGQASAASQTIEQTAQQRNLLQALGEVDVTLVVEGGFHESIHDVAIGLVSADVVQANLALQEAANNGGGTPSAARSIEQHITQNNTVGVNGGTQITITIDSGYADPIADLEIGLVVGSILQANSSVQAAINLGGAWSLLA